MELNINDSMPVVFDIDTEDFENELKLNPHTTMVSDHMRQHVQPILSICDELDTIVLNYNKGYIVNQEGFSSLINSPLTGIVNVIGHVTKLFSTALFSGWRDFKRSELKEYQDSNIASVALLLNSGVYQDYQFCEIDTPVGMVATYPVAINAISDYLNELDMVNKSKGIEKMLDAIKVNCSQVNPAFTSHVADLNRTVISTTVERKFTAMSKIFGTSKTSKGLFKNHFFDMSALKKAVHDVISMDTHLVAVASVYARLEHIIAIVEQITENTKNLKASEVANLSKAIRAIAVLFEQYAIVLNDLNRINHNLTLVLVQLRNKS